MVFDGRLEFLLVWSVIHSLFESKIVWNQNLFEKYCFTKKWKNNLCFVVSIGCLSLRGFRKGFEAV